MGRPFRILSLNGGGIRGIFQAGYLKHLERELGSPLHEHFDLICGTSTGAIVGMAVAMGIDSGRIVELYKNKGEEIFRKKLFRKFRRGPLYNQDSLKKELVNIFGTHTLNDTKTKVIVTSSSLNHFKHKVFSNFATIGKSEGHYSIVDAVLSSSAAPTYFLPVQPLNEDRCFVDGGLWANCPASLAILFTNKYLKISLVDIKLLSIGTGDIPTISSLKYFKRLRQVSVSSVRTIFELMFASQASFSDEYAKEILGNDNYIRISAQLPEEIALDDFKKAIEILPGLAQTSFDVSLSNVKRLLFNNESASNQIIQDIGRDKLISDDLIQETGLTAFFPTREHYNFRGNTNSIHAYVDTAKESLLMVSITLVKGINFDNLRVVLERKLDLDENFEIIISLLNPNKQYLMESLCAVFEKTADEIKRDILDSIGRLKGFKKTLSPKSQTKFQLRFHNTIPFGSAIIIDRSKPYGKIQIESKAYKVPMGKSFAFETIPYKKDGFYDTLLEGYLNLINDGEEIF